MPPHPTLKHPELWEWSCTLQLWDAPWGSLFFTDSSALGGVHRWLATGRKKCHERVCRASTRVHGGGREWTLRRLHKAVAFEWAAAGGGWGVPQGHIKRELGRSGARTGGQHGGAAKRGEQSAHLERQQGVTGV